MHRRNPALLVLLLASLLGNILLAARLSRSGGDSPTPPGKPELKDSATFETGLVSLRETLAAERKKNEELQARIERLETDKKVLAQDAPGAAAKGDKVSAFRDKLRKLKKMMADPKFKNGAGADPDSVVELTETMMEFVKLAAVRSKEPKLYAEYLHALYDVGLDGEGTSLTPGQSTSLTDLLQGYADELSRVPTAPAGEHLLKEVQLEGSVMGKVQSLLTDAQRGALKADQFEAFSSMNFLSTSYVTKQGAADQIAQQWSAQYQLDASQLPQAKAAAQAYVDALARLDTQTKGGDPTLSQPGSGEAYAYREAMIREQLAALATLQASMTSDQAERLRTQTMKEIHILDASGESQAVTTPGK